MIFVFGLLRALSRTRAQLCSGPTAPSCVAPFSPSPYRRPHSPSPQRARLLSTALSAAELVVLPLGAEYASIDAGLLPLSRGLLASLAVTELWGPTAAARAAAPELAQRPT